MADDARDPDTASSAKTHGRGIVVMLLCTLAFAVMDGLSKLLIVTYPVSQIMFIRYAFFLLFVIALTRPRNVPARLAVRRPWYQVLRACVLVADQVVFILGLSYLALADAHVLVSASPLMVAALSVPMLGERVGPRRVRPPMRKTALSPKEIETTGAAKSVSSRSWCRPMRAPGA